MSSRFAAALCWLMLPWTLAGACHDVERRVGDACKSDRDCREPFVCALGACRAPCDVDRDCDGGACLVVDESTRVCSLPDERGCGADSGVECPAGFACGVDGECRNPCDATRRCPADRRCVEGTCFSTPSAAGAGGAPGDGGDTAGGEAGTPGGDGGANEGGGASDRGGANEGGGAAGEGSLGGAADEGCGVGDVRIVGDGQSAAEASDLPSIDYVSPYVAYEGEQQLVVIRGKRFPSSATVCFGKRRAGSVEVKSATEIRAVPPARSGPGRFTVAFGAGVETAHANAELLVRSHPTYASASLVTDVGFQDRHVIYDAERDAVFSYCSWFGDYSSTNPSTINRYVHDARTGEWGVTSHYVPDLWDIGLSPDGKYLLALATSRLWLLDPVTLSSRGYVDFAPVTFGTAGQLGVANDGKVLIRDLGKAYSLVDGTFSPAQFPSAIGIVFSADGSLGVVGDANTSATVPLSVYDAGSGRIKPSQTYEYFQLPSLERHGSRYFAGGHVRDGELSLIGGVPTYMGYMRPDGKRAYEVDGSDRTHLHVYDLVGDGPSFPALDDIIVSDAIDAYWLHASLDSRFLFAPGPRTFQVIPLH